MVAAFHEKQERRRGRRRRGPHPANGDTANKIELIKSRCLRASMACRFTLPRRFRPIRSHHLSGDQIPIEEPARGSHASVRSAHRAGRRRGESAFDVTPAR